MKKTFPDNITNKIKSVNDLKKILDKNSLKKSVMCHGTFDIVHPGHMRHLMFAKSKGDILIASLTADEYITKKVDGAFIPEDLRATNLALIELIDFVLIDRNKSPVINIKKLKPNIFVKGFEYSKDGIHPKTKEEIAAVEGCGGKVIFSPGDIVYSSTQIQQFKIPDLRHEKLLSVMEAESISFSQLESTIDQFKNIKVHVIGDTIVDKYNYCSILGPTTKTPTFSVKYNNSEMFVGGAGVVAKHLKGLGADVTLSTIFGNDKLGTFASKDISTAGINLEGVVDTQRPTTLKERFWADGYKLLQVDTLENSIVSEEIMNQLLKYIKKSKSDIFIFSDFRHGIFNKYTIPEYLKSMPKNSLKVADSQVSNRWGNILDFHGCDLILPNEKEARFSLADQDSGVRPLGTELYNKSKAKYLILKLDERGLMTFREKKKSLRYFFALDSFVENMVDGVGAGDALLGASSLGLFASNNIVIASILGNIAAAIACETPGNVPISPSKIVQKLHDLKSKCFINE